MAVGRKYRPYREVLRQLKLKQLDIYRYKDHEVLRLRTQSNEVVLIKLPRRRDEMTPEEFKKYIEESLAQARKQ